MKTVLSIQSIEKSYPIQRGVFRRTIGYSKIIKGISFDIYQGEILAIVGESGCGKSTLARLMMGLESPSNGKIIYRGTSDRLGASDELSTSDALDELQQNESRGIRIDNLSHNAQMPIRRAIQMVFQDPAAALNERFSVGKIVREPLDIHGIGNASERKKAVADILTAVELPTDFIHRYPHELSGGQRQRVAIARSLIVRPHVLVLDEPLSALDVSLQDQMISLFKKLQTEFNLTIVMISHDLGLVEDFSDRTLVLNFGEIAELRDTRELFSSPYHEYTKSLLASIPHKIGKTRF